MPEWASEDGRPPRSPRSRSNIRPQALRLAEGTEGDQDRPAEQELHRGRSEQVDAVPQPPHENGAPSRRRGGQQRQSDAFGVVAPELAAATTTTPPRAWPALPRSRSDPRSANQSQPAAVRTSSWPLASTEATAASARLAGRYIAPKASVALASDSTSTTASGGRPALGSSVGLPAPPISARAPASKRGAGSGNETWMRTKQSPPHDGDQGRDNCRSNVHPVRHSARWLRSAGRRSIARRQPGRHSASIPRAPGQLARQFSPQTLTPASPAAQRRAVASLASDGWRRLATSPRAGGVGR